MIVKLPKVVLPFLLVSLLLVLMVSDVVLSNASDLRCDVPDWYEEGKYVRYTFVRTKGNILEDKSVITIEIKRFDKTGLANITVASIGLHNYSIWYTYNACKDRPQVFEFYVPPSELREIKKEQQLVTENIGFGNMTFVKERVELKRPNKMMVSTRWIHPSTGLVIGELDLIKTEEERSISVYTNRYILLDTNILNISSLTKPHLESTQVGHESSLSPIVSSFTALALTALIVLLMLGTMYYLSRRVRK